MAAELGDYSEAASSHSHRRKDKEIEHALQCIAELQQQLEVTHCSCNRYMWESEFDRSERDYFRAMAGLTPGQTPIAQRPCSPRRFCASAKRALKKPRRR